MAKSSPQAAALVHRRCRLDAAHPTCDRPAPAPHGSPRPFHVTLWSEGQSPVRLKCRETQENVFDFFIRWSEKLHPRRTRARAERVASGGAKDGSSNLYPGAPALIAALRAAISSAQQVAQLRTLNSNSSKGSDLCDVAVETVVLKTCLCGESPKFSAL